jgi:hypothetical protein
MEQHRGISSVKPVSSVVRILLNAYQLYVKNKRRVRRNHRRVAIRSIS